MLFSEDSALCSVKPSALDGIRSLEIKGKFFIITMLNGEARCDTLLSENFIL